LDSFVEPRVRANDFGLGATEMPEKRWSHFHHGADIGVRGIGHSMNEAFEQAGLALTAVITDPEKVAPNELIRINCTGPDVELLFADWLNALVFEMDTRKMLFSRFEVHCSGNRCEAKAWGEKVDVARHEPAVEVKGATYTSLQVAQDEMGTWLAQCVVDV
jgi:tRNA nucleotidyltransferase (CCA-adding enzyme)